MTAGPAAEASRTVLADMVADRYGDDDERAPLVLLHGLTFRRQTWRPVLDELSRLDPGRRVLVLDLPGHGESPSQLPHTFAHLVDLLHEAALQADLQAPILVGHSHAGGLAAMYAARHPSRGFVTVDSAPADVPAFVRLLRQFEPTLRSPDFARVWEHLEASFQLDRLPRPMRDLVEETCTPKQDLLLGYWDELLAWSEADVAAMLDGVLAGLHARHVPQVLVLGNAPSPALREFLAGGSRAHAELMVEDWSPSGHFPHLAHVSRFAELLARTGAWTAPTLSDGSEPSPTTTPHRLRDVREGSPSRRG